MYTIIATWIGKQLLIAITHDYTLAAAIARAVWNGAIPLHTDTALEHIKIYDERGDQIPWDYQRGRNPEGG